jgi:hypothetical protein
MMGFQLSSYDLLEEASLCRKFGQLKNFEFQQPQQSTEIDE